MANGPRSIYSRRQRMAPGQYDNPLADFLDNLPAYFNQYQQNQLALEQQKLQTKRYDDAQKQQVFRNELTLINSLPESARAKAMLSSENEGIQEAGKVVEDESNAFDAMLNPSDISEPENQQLEYYNNLLNSPSVRNNQARINQVKGKIQSINNNLLQSQVKTWHDSNKDNPNAKIILQQSQYDPSGAIKNIINLKPKERRIIKDVENRKRYEDDKSLVFPNVKTPVVDKFATPNAQLEALTNLYNKASLESKLNPEDEDLQRKLVDLEADIARFIEVSLPNNRFGGLNTASPESTGTRFDIKLDF